MFIQSITPTYAKSLNETDSHLMLYKLPDHEWCKVTTTSFTKQILGTLVITRAG